MDSVKSVIHMTELIGTIAFAVSGVIVAIDRKLDFFGAMVLGIITAVGGGITRDILLGITPPTTFQDYTFFTAAMFTSFLMFLINFFGKNLERYEGSISQIINVFDAVGLGIFTVVGVNTAIINGQSSNIFLCLLIGIITGVGGGMLRDVLANRVPMVLYKRIYALAAAVGAGVYYALYSIRIHSA